MERGTHELFPLVGEGWNVERGTQEVCPLVGEGWNVDQKTPAPLPVPTLPIPSSADCFPTSCVSSISGCPRAHASRALRRATWRSGTTSATRR